MRFLFSLAIPYQLAMGSICPDAPLTAEEEENMFFKGTDCDYPHVCTYYACAAQWIGQDETDAVSDVDSFDTDSNPCPSDECWTFDGDKCILTPGCTTLECGAEEMTVGILKGVFGEGKPQNLKIAPVMIGSVIQAGYGGSCRLGECGMTHQVVEIDGINQLEFRLTIASDSSNKINLGDITVTTGASDITVEFVCTYPMEVMVTSGSFSVQGSGLSGTTTGFGNLADGFGLSVMSPNGKFLLGSMVRVTASWSVSLPGVTFRFEECSIQQDAKSVKIIKNGCLSGAIGVHGMTRVDGDLSYNYKVFNIEDTASASQDILCKITICIGDCDKIESCPQSPLYNYTPNGSQ